MSWCWHKWSKWEDHKINVSYASGDNPNTQLPIKRILVQRKICLKCEMKRFRRELISGHE